MSSNIPMPSGARRQSPLPAPSPDALLSPRQREEGALASPAAEREVLGAMLCGKSPHGLWAWQRGVELLRPPHYHDWDTATPRHATMQSVLSRLWLQRVADGKDSPIRVLEPRLVILELDRLGLLGRAGGKAYVWGLRDGCSSAANLEHHAGRVLDYAKRRALVALQERIRDAAYAHRPLQEILDRAALDFGDIRRFGWLRGADDGLEMVRAGDVDYQGVR